MEEAPADAERPTGSRLAALDAYAILDTPPEDRFDDIVLIASALCDAPVALISLVAEARQWFKARVGLELRETPIEQSVCALGLQQSEPLVIPDLSRDPRTCANTLVTAPDGLRFYAGAPLTTPQGVSVGMLCVIDKVPRPGGLAPAQASALQALARQVVALLEMRRLVQARDAVIIQQHAWGADAAARAEVLEETDARVRAAQVAGRIGTFEIEVATGAMAVSTEFRHLYGLKADQRVDAAVIEALAVVRDGTTMSNAVSQQDGGAPPDVEYQIRRADDGQLRWLNRRANFMRDAAGEVVRMFGTLHDITERRLADERVNALLELGDRLREASAASEITKAAAEILGRTLKVVRAGYADLDHGAGELVVAHDWTANGVQSLVGRAPAAAFATTLELLARGQTVAVANVPAASWLEPDLPTYRALGVHAQIKAPLLVRGQIAGLIFVHESSPRSWTKPEIEFVHGVADRTYAALAKVRAEAEQQVLNHELSHRLKNTLAMVQAIASQTLKAVPEREPVEAFNQRLHALSTAHDLLLQSSWTSADLAAVVDKVMRMVSGTERCDIAGPEIALSPRTTLSISLLVHELATNALKYGALSSDRGRVAVTWRVEPTPAGPALKLDWRESGGPPAATPTRRGFGSRLIRTGLTGTGDVQLSYLNEGFSAQFVAMLAQVQQS